MIKYASLTQTFRTGVSTEFKTMCWAISRLLQQFPNIMDDITQANQDTKPLISKVRKVCDGTTVIICGYMHDYMHTDICLCMDLTFTDFR